MAENGSDVRSGPALGKEQMQTQAIASEDLFPPLDLESLVAAKLGTFGVIAEAFRLFSHHLKSFRLPILVVTVQTILEIVFQLLVPGDRAWGLSIPGPILHSSRLRLPNAYSYSEYSRCEDSYSYSYSRCQDSYSDYYWYEYWFPLLGAVVSLLLSGFAEAAFDRAAVGAYFRESQGPGQGQAPAPGLVPAALRAIATKLAVVVATVALAWVVAVVAFLALALLNMVLPAYDAAVLVSFWVVVALVAVAAIYLTVVLIVAVPAAVVTRVWWFQALQRSFRLSKGNRGVAFKLVLLGLVISNALGVAGYFGRFIGTIVIAGVPRLIVSVAWHLIRIVLYLKFRASHKVAVNDVEA